MPGPRVLLSAKAGTLYSRTGAVRYGDDPAIAKARGEALEARGLCDRAQTLDAERERMDPRDNPLTPKPSCEELKPPANPARFRPVRLCQERGGIDDLGVDPEKLPIDVNDVAQSDVREVHVHVSVLR